MPGHFVAKFGERPTIAIVGRRRISHRTVLGLVRLGPRANCRFQVNAALAALLLATAAAARAETSADVLRRGPGARPAGLGGAFAGVVDDGHAAAWNPAGLSLLRRQAAFASRFGFSGTNLESAGWGRPWGTGGLGAHLTVAHGSRNAAKAQAAASARVLHALHVGAGVAAATARQDGKTATTGLLDLGLLAAAVPGVTVGAVAQNVGLARLHGAPPEQWRLGAAVRFADTDLSRLGDLMVSLEAAYARFRRLGAAKLGVEYRLGDWALRLGASAGHPEQTEGRLIAAGFGWKHKGVGLDYTLAPAKRYGDAHRLGVTWEFGYLSERPAADYLLRMDSYEVAEESESPASIHLIERRFTRAERHYQAAHHKLGLRELEHVKRLLPPDDPRLLRWYDAYGRGLLALKDWPFAREHFAEGLQLARGLKAEGERIGHLLAGLGEALARLRRRDEAVSCLARALEHGTAPERRRPLEDLLLELKFAAAGELDQLPDVEMELLCLRTDDPRYLRAVDGYGRRLLALRDWKAARELYVEGIRVARERKAKGPPIADLYAGFGQALAGEQRPDDAVVVLETALKEGASPQRRKAVEELLLRLRQPPR